MIFGAWPSWLVSLREECGARAGPRLLYRTKDRQGKPHFSLCNLKRVRFQHACCLQFRFYQAPTLLFLSFLSSPLAPSSFRYVTTVLLSRMPVAFLTRFPPRACPLGIGPHVKFHRRTLAQQLLQPNKRARGGKRRRKADGPPSKVR